MQLTLLWLTRLLKLNEPLLQIYDLLLLLKLSLLCLPSLFLLCGESCLQLQ